MKGKKLLIFTFIIAFIFQFLVPSPNVKAAGTDISNAFPLITDLNITDQNGNALGNSIDKSSEIHINYTWSIPNEANINQGDFYTMQLPDQISIVAPIDQPLLDVNDNSSVVANMHIDTNGKVTITFTSYASTHSDVHGGISVDCHFDKDNIGNINPVYINFEIPAKGTIQEGPFNFIQPNPSISKSGNYNPTTDEITWTVTLNQEGVKLNDATLDDLIGSGQDFVDGSVLVNGSNPSDIGASYTYDSSSKELALALGTITTQQVITYKTSIHSDLSTKAQGTYNYSNNAILNYSDEISAKSITSNTASVPVNVNYISKSGNYNASTKSIDWTITVNGSGRTIHNTTVTDNIPSGLTLDYSSVSGAPFSTSGQTVTFDLGDITSSQTITYSTPVDTSIYNSNGYTNYNNTAILSGDEVPNNTSATSSVGVSSNIIQKQGIGYDASTGIITWKVIVNSNNTSVSAGALVTDNIPVGQTYVPNSAVLDNTTGISDSTSYTAAASGDTSKTGTFTYTFPDAFSDTHTITFKTQITDSKVYLANFSGNYNNSVTLTANGINQTASGTQPVNSQIINKTSTGYNYATREISWSIVVDKNKMPIHNAVITDNIPAGQEYVADSAAITNGANTSGFNYTDISNDASKTGVLTYTFSNAISNMYTITFKTRVSDLSIFNSTGIKSLSNCATINGDEIPTNGNRQSTATQTINNTIVNKTASYTSGNSYISWTVNVNPNYNLSMGGTTITDDLQSGLSLNTDTVQLYNAVVNANGTLSAGNNIALTAQNVKYDSTTGEFNFTFPQDAGTSAYILKFITNVAKTGSYTNSVKFNGSSLIQSAPATQNISWISNGSGWGVGTTGSITVEKVDGNDNTKTLSGAIFELIDQYGNVKATSSATGSDGKALFSTLKYDTNYSIKEITPPKGYNLSSEIYNFQVHNATGQQNIVYDYQDTKIKKDISFTKLGQDGKALQGAEFTLYKSDGITPILDAEGKNVTATSDVNGIVTFPSIDYGDYKIKESTAPAGYLLSSDVIAASFSGDYSNTVVTVTPNSISNQLITGGIKITKTDASTSAPLPGATIEVFTSDGNQVGNGIEGITGTDGTVEFDNLPYGNYYFMETNAPEGYSINTDKHPFSITDNGVIVNATISDTKITGGIKITKVDNSIPSFIPGTTIGFFTSDGTQFGSATKEADGFDGNIQLNKLSYGNYYFSETNVPNGYLLNTNKHPFSINREDNFIPLLVSGLTITIYSSNGTEIGTVTKETTGFDVNAKFDSLAYGSYYFVETGGPIGYPLNTAKHPFSVTETDTSTSAPVPGATIAVFTSDGRQVANGTEGITGADGTVEFDNLPYGNYYFIETNAPEGYSINTDEHPFSITDNGVIVNATISDAKLNPGTDITKITGGIKITKTDAATSVPVPGATIEVFTGDGNQVANGIEGITGADGTVEFDNLPYGSYYFLETKAPEGYLINTDKHPFSITDNGVILKDTISDTKIVPTPPPTPVPTPTPAPVPTPTPKITGGIKITKVDSSIPSFIPGTTIGFFTSDGTQFGSATKEADGFDGNIQLNKLSYGNYYFSETNVPNGYLLNTNKHPFSINREDNFIPLLVPGLTITIYSSNGTEIGTVTKETTGFDVNAKFDNLAYGSYYFVETGGPIGYPLNTAKHPFSVAETDTSTSAPVPGATITVFTSDGRQVANGTEGITGADGTVEFDNLPAGDYYFLETKAPTGYSINTDKHPFSITDNGVILNATISDAKLNPGTDITKITGGIKITKTDAATSAPVPGATITIFTSNGNQVANGTEGITGADGTVEFDNLPAGDYYFLETKAPTGYLINPDKHPFSITDNGVILRDTISDTKIAPTPTPTPVPTPKITGGIKITKTDAATSAPIPGATITIFTSNGNQVANGTEGITGADGTVEFDNLPAGDYYFLETKAPTGYLINPDKHPFSITDNGVILRDTISDTKIAPTPTPTPVPTPKITGGIKITKTDAATSAPIPGATITIFTSNGNQVANGTEGITGADGTVEFDNLPAGDYYFLETKAPTGYLINPDKHPFSITDNGVILRDTISDTKIAPTPTPAPVPTPKITGGIKITKTDAATSAPIPGATITIFSSNGNQVANGTEGITGTDGTVEFDNLPAGDYYFLETKAPTGYLINPDKHPFSITDNGVILRDTISDTKIVPIPTPKPTPKITGGIKISKTDAATSAPIPGATITIFSSDGKQVGNAKVTGPDGSVEFDNLPYGDYYFVESNAPEGYPANTDKHPFSITANGVVLKDTILSSKSNMSNVPRTNTAPSIDKSSTTKITTLPQTGGLLDTKLIIIIGLLIILGGILILIISKKSLRNK
ncbi:SpaA isopeptide-forming pilin-related protein [Clostridium hydrogenum]|uniref:SpaA isopeptide-forming pilin-related protein n=1 Tax=Clostridium hydrogenum TaxID=2855764 RepID=UPI001F19F9B8|nr:SpaA isopeptide-forming pilin-related protein [Clostridium hydrogenum]